MKLRPIKPSRTKEYIVNGLIMFFFIIVMIMLVVVILSYFRNDAAQECCEQNNATYVFFECQCNAMIPCSEDLKCGNYCQFEDGSYIEVELLNCEVNST